MKKVQDLTDRELQEGQFKYLRDISNNTYSIKIWVTIFGFFTVVGLIIVLIQQYG